MTNIGRLLSSLIAQERVEKAKQERPQERYARIVIKLDDVNYVGTDIELHLVGDYLGKIKYDGSATGCYIKLGNRHAGRIYASEFRRTYAEFDRIYLTNPSSQAGKVLVIVVGGAFSGEIEPSTGAKSGIIDSSGADVDPANLTNQALIVADSDDIRIAIESLENNAFDSSTDTLLLSADKIEDTGHTTGDKGFMLLAVRKDTASALAGSDADYIPLIVDNLGKLHVVLNKAASATKAGISVGSTSTTVLAANAARKFAVIVNDSNEVVYIAFHATAVLNQGIRLNASGGAYEINASNLYTGIITGICASGGKNVAVTEG